MIVALILSISFSGIPAQLESQAKSAFADIARAKSSLNAGNGKSGESWLSKAEGKLGSLLDEVPGGSALKSQNQSSNGAVSKAESEAAKLDPSLAGKLGIGGQQAQPPQQNGTQAAPPSGLARIADAYQKVAAARSLLNSGAVTKAKGLLDQIPSL